MEERCWSWCQQHGGVRYWGGPGRRDPVGDALVTLVAAAFWP